jgi:hypothetical protein
MENFNEDIEKLRRSINQLNVDKRGRSASQMPMEQCEAVIKRIQDMAGFDDRTKALAAIVGVCQRGGTNRTASSVSSAFTVDGKEVTAQMLTQACNQVARGTPRQFARTMGTTIFKVAYILGEEGDLARQMAIEVPNLTDEQKCWCSNFQTGNMDCPADVREWLVANFRKRFPR